jgi:peptide deformylase
MLKIIEYPHPTLRKKARPVKKFTPQVQGFCQDLLRTLVPDPEKPLGVGLAANQVNRLWRVIVIKMPDDQYEVLVNPQIIKTSKKMLSQLIPEDKRFFEGCLSIPGYYAFVDRPAKIKIKYQTPLGLTKQKALTPPYSSYFQHELDHLNGILFIDYLPAKKEQLYLADKTGKLNPTANPFV